MKQNPTTDMELPEQSEARKKDHIEMAFKSLQDARDMDHRFFYEPLLSSHPSEDFKWEPFSFAGKQLKVPIWVSSMTGGTQMAEAINRNLSRACAEFGMGFGLGSCRSLLEGNYRRLKDFDFREVIGPDLPFYANLGIAQVQKIAEQKEWNRVEELIGKLRADGLIIHVNPMQEALQPEGDRFKVPPLDTIQSALGMTGLRIIVKEVGQGFGKNSLKELMKLPLQAIEFGAHGGTNFSKLELLRSDERKMKIFAPLAGVGHTAEEMTGFVNDLKSELGGECKVKDFIVSGGVKDYLDGYYFINKIQFKSVYGQASGFLKYATGDYENLQNYVSGQLQGYKLAKSFLRIK